MEHLATKSHTGLSGIGGGQNRAKRRANIGLIFIRWTKAQLQMNANIVLCLLNVEIGNC